MSRLSPLGRWHLVLGIWVVLWLGAPAMVVAQWNQQEAGHGGNAEHAGILRGTVVNGVTHEPVGRAVVFSSDGRFAVMTDERGRFEMVFKKKAIETNSGVANGAGVANGGIAGDVPGGIGGESGESIGGVGGAGVAQGEAEWDRPDFLTARKNGFLDVNDGTSGVGVGRDQSEVTLTIVPEARVVGHVTLAGGDGAWGMQVSLYKRQVDAGRVRWLAAGKVIAKSDGEFRFAELGAGSYKLFSEELLDTDPLTSDPRGQLYGYPPLYYPAAADFGSAAVIHLTAGETFPASLSPEKRKYYPVRIGLAPVAGGVVPQVEVSREGHDGPGFSLGYDFRDGSIGGTLPDGNYSVKVVSAGGTGMTGTANVSVHGGPAAGGPLVMVPGATIRVRVNEEFSRGQEKGAAAWFGGHSVQGPQSVQVTLIPAEEFDNQQQYAGQPPQAPTADDDALVIENVPPGKYRVAAQPSQTGYVASMRCGDTDVQHSNLEVGAGATMPPIEITMRDDGADVNGTVIEMAEQNRGKATPTVWQPTAPAVVYFVPVRERADVREAWVQFNGDFELRQLAPGTYRVLPFDRPKPNLEFTNEEAMARYDAQVITVAPGQKEHLRVSFLQEQ